MRISFSLRSSDKGISLNEHVSCTLIRVILCFGKESLDQLLSVEGLLPYLHPYKTAALSRTITAGEYKIYYILEALHVERVE